MRRFLIVYAVVTNILLVDAFTKEVAARCLKGAAARSLIDGFFALTYVENRGCAWGMLQGHVWPLAVFGLVAFALLVWKRASFFVSAGKLGLIAEPLLYAGILGNVIDRFVRGYVVDFFDFHWAEAYHFPCFNVADVCISVAAALLVLSSVCSKRK